jgi:hypothetical protein
VRTVTETCERCGAIRETTYSRTMGPVTVWWEALFGKKERIKYTMPPDYEGQMNVECRALGHLWPSDPTLPPGWSH